MKILILLLSLSTSVFAACPMDRLLDSSLSVDEIIQSLGLYGEPDQLDIRSIRMVERLGISSGDNVLVVGLGMGGTVLASQLRGANVHAVDVGARQSPTMKSGYRNLLYFVKERIDSQKHPEPNFSFDQIFPSEQREITSAIIVGYLDDSWFEHEVSRIQFLRRLFSRLASSAKLIVQFSADRPFKEEDFFKLANKIPGVKLKRVSHPGEINTGVLYAEAGTMYSFAKDSSFQGEGLGVDAPYVGNL